MIIFRQAIKPPAGKYSRRSANVFSHQEQSLGIEIKSEENIKKNKELQRLAFFGAGPKLPGTIILLGGTLCFIVK